MRFFAVFGFLLLTVACTRTQVSMDYQPRAAATPSDSRPIVAVGTFTDQRKHASHWLGAIRGGFGNPLKTLETPIPVSEVVRRAFIEGLRSRGLLSDDPNAPYTLTAVVHQFDSNQVGRREAHTNFLVMVRDNKSGQLIMSEPFRRDIVTGSMITFDAGIFASTDDLQAVAMQALHETVDAALDSPSLQRARMQ